MIETPFPQSLKKINWEHYHIYFKKEKEKLFSAYFFQKFLIIYKLLWNYICLVVKIQQVYIVSQVQILYS